MTDDEEDEGERPRWEEVALRRIEGILATAEFDAVDGTVTLESDLWHPKGDTASRTSAWRTFAGS